MLRPDLAGPGRRLVLGYDDFSYDGAVTQAGEGAGSIRQRNDFIDARLELAGSGPFESGCDVGAGPAVTADQALFLDEEGPEVELDVASGGGAAGYDGPISGEAFEAALEELAADVFDDKIDASFSGQVADLSGPIGEGGIDGMLSAEFFGESAFVFAGTGGDDVGAEFEGDLDGGGADAAGRADDQDPLPAPDLGAVREHVHGGAAGEGESGGAFEAGVSGEPNQGTGGDGHFFSETAVALHSEQLAMETE